MIKKKLNISSLAGQCYVYCYLLQAWYNIYKLPANASHNPNDANEEIDQGPIFTNNCSP